jgi:uncharacterized protein (TIRG00374 family)
MMDSNLPANTEPLRSFQLTTRRIVLIVVMGALSVALLLALGGGREAVGAIFGANGWLLLAATLIHYSGFALRGHRWELLLRVMGHTYRYRTLTVILLAGWFASALLPGRAGDLLRVAALRSELDGQPPTPVADSLGSIVLERALDLFAILSLGAFFGFVALRTHLPAWVLTGYAAALTLLILFALVVLLAPRLLGGFRRLSSNRWWLAACDFAERFVTSLRTLARQPKVAGLATIESLYIWLCDALLLWLVVWSLGNLLPFANAAFVALTVDVFAAVPLTPGGVGQIEAANTALLSFMALTPSSAVAAVLLVRFISYWSFLFFSGLVTFASGFAALLRSSEKKGAERGHSALDSR